MLELKRPFTDGTTHELFECERFHRLTGGRIVCAKVANNPATNFVYRMSEGAHSHFIDGGGDGGYALSTAEVKAHMLLAAQSEHWTCVARVFTQPQSTTTACNDESPAATPA